MSDEIQDLIDQCAQAERASPELDVKISRLLGAAYIMPLSGDLNGCVNLVQSHAPGWYFTLATDAQGPNVWMYNRRGLTSGGRGATLWGALLAATLMAYTKTRQQEMELTQ